MLLTPFGVGVLLVLLGEGAALGANELRIHNGKEFIDFSNNVNSGTSYSGITVYLDSDIVFDSFLSQQFQPIGEESNHFSGTFDGQGHTVRSLTLNSSSSEYVGLFGYSSGATIKNVVLDASCSIVSSVNSGQNSVEMGSISGRCKSCVIERAVNMVTVSFAGTTESYLFIGGLVGRLVFSSTIQNCVNYGLVEQTGRVSGEYCDIGGIVGSCEGYFTKSIQNTANYGTITHSGTSNNLYVGGIFGDSIGETIVENCISAGNIENAMQATKNNYIGAIEGLINFDSKTNIIHSFWTIDVGCSTVYGHKSPSAQNVSIISSYAVPLNAATVDKMNRHTEENGMWDKWFILHLNGGRVNNLNQETLIVTQKHFPYPAKEGSTFSFWSFDSGCSGNYDSEAVGITEITGIYACWDVSLIAFELANLTTSDRTLNFNGTALYPGNA